MKSTREKGRLTRSNQYTQVYREVHPWVSPLMVVRVMPNGLTITRYGFTISKKVGPAVTRNLIKRRLTEILRVVPLSPGWDIVITLRPAAAKASFAELKRAIEGLLMRAHLLVRENEGLCLKAN